MIRAAEPADAAQLAALHVAAWRRGCHDILPAAVLTGVTIDRRARDWTRWLASPRTSTYVCEYDGRLLGFTSVGALRANGRPSRSLLGVRMLYVDPDSWRIGIGRALHERTVRAAREGGFTQIVLWVLTRNQRARAFYAALGFEPDRTRHGTLGGHPVDETRYCLGSGSARARLAALVD